MLFRRSYLVLALILLLAAGLRFYRIDAQSLWSDEGSSVAQALRDLPSIAANAARDIHPPFYYILLHYWVIPFGITEAAVRSLSAVLAVALVVMVYALGKAWWSERVALIAAFLASINPFLIYYAQEARMYTLMALLGVVCVYATTKSQIPRPKTQDPNTRDAKWFVVYAVAAILGLYTHYFFPILLAVCNVLFIADCLLARMLLLLAGEGRIGGGLPLAVGEGRGEGELRGLIPWLGVQIVVALAFLPWAPTAIRQITTWPSGALTFTATDAPIVLLRTLSEGLSAPANDGVWLVAFALLLVMGAIPMKRAVGLQSGTASQKTLAVTRMEKGTASQPTRTLTEERDRLSLRGGAFPPWQSPLVGETASQRTLAVTPSLAALLYLLAAIAAMYALSLFKDAFLKFVIIAVPPFVLLVASGLDRLTRMVAQHATRNTQHATRGMRLISPYLLLFPLISLISFLSLRAYYFDPRFARDDYRSIVQTIEAIGAEDDAIILDAPGQQEIFSYYYHGALPVYPLPAQRPPDATDTENTLQSLASKYGRLFVVLWATDESDPARLVESWLDTHTFKSTDNWYGNVRLALYANSHVPGEAQHPADARFGDAITLQGYSLGVESVDAGDILPLTLFWRADGPVARRYKVFVHLLDPRGFVIAQRDAEPVGGSRPTSGWAGGETVADPYGLFVPFGTPPLAYQIEIGLYDPDSGARLKTAGGDDHLVLGTVGVQATTSVRAIPGMLPLNLPSTGGLTLLGYQLDKVGAEGQRDPQFRAGDGIHLTLYWRRSGTLSGDGGYLLQVGPLTRQTTPTGGLYPPGQWRPGEVVRDDQILALPAAIAPGSYAVQVAGRTIAQVNVQ